MTIQECYAALEGDYQEVLGRLYSEALVQKFVGKFLADQSFQLLESSMKTENYEEAFRAAHTLKGVCQNLSFTRLYQSSHEITEALRTRPGSCCRRWRRTIPEPQPPFRPIRPVTEHKDIPFPDGNGMSFTLFYPLRLSAQAAYFSTLASQAALFSPLARM